MDTDPSLLIPGLPESDCTETFSLHGKSNAPRNDSNRLNSVSGKWICGWDCLLNRFLGLPWCLNSRELTDITRKMWLSRYSAFIQPSHRGKLEWKEHLNTFKLDNRGTRRIKAVLSTWETLCSEVAGKGAMIEHRSDEQDAWDSENSTMRETKDAKTNLSWRETMSGTKKENWIYSNWWNKLHHFNPYASSLIYAFTNQSIVFGLCSIQS